MILSGFDGEAHRFQATAPSFVALLHCVLYFCQRGFGALGLKIDGPWVFQLSAGNLNILTPETHEAQKSSTLKREPCCSGLLDGSLLKKRPASGIL